MARGAPVLAAVLALVSFMDGAAAADANNEWNDGTSGDFADPSRWATDVGAANVLLLKYPTATYTVTLADVFDTIVNAVEIGIGHDVSSPGVQTLVIASGGRLEVMRAVTVMKTAVLRIEEGGELVIGDGVLAIHGRLEVVGGTIVGHYKSKLEVKDGASMEITGSGLKLDMCNVHLQDNSTCDWKAGDVLFEDSLATSLDSTYFRVDPSASLTVHTGGSMENERSPVLSVLMLNGTLTLQAGTLSIHTATEVEGLGAFDIADGTDLHFSGDVTVLSDVPTFEGPTGATVTFNGAVVHVHTQMICSPTLRMMGQSTLGGNGTLVARGPVEWTDSHMTGYGSTELEGTASARGTIELHHRTVRVHGVMAANGTSILAEGSLVEVLPSATLDLTAATVITASTCELSVGASADVLLSSTTLECILLNAGQVTESGGQSVLSGGGVQDGTLDVTGEMRFIGGTWEFKSSSHVLGLGSGNAISVSNRTELSFEALASVDGILTLAVNGNASVVFDGSNAIVLDELQVLDGGEVQSSRPINTVLMMLSGRMDMRDAATLTVVSSANMRASAAVVGVGSMHVPVGASLHFVGPPLLSSSLAVPVLVEGTWSWAVAGTCYVGELITIAPSALVSVSTPSGALVRQTTRAQLLNHGTVEILSNASLSVGINADNNGTVMYNSSSLLAFDGPINGSWSGSSTTVGLGVLRASRGAVLSVRGNATVVEIVSLSFATVHYTLPARLQPLERLNMSGGSVTLVSSRGVDVHDSIHLNTGTLASLEALRVAMSAGSITMQSTGNTLHNIDLVASGSSRSSLHAGNLSLIGDASISWMASVNTTGAFHVDGVVAISGSLFVEENSTFSGSSVTIFPGAAVHVAPRGALTLAAGSHGVCGGVLSGDGTLRVPATGIVHWGRGGVCGGVVPAPANPHMDLRVESAGVVHVYISDWTLAKGATISGQVILHDNATVVMASRAPETCMFSPGSNVSGSGSAVFLANTHTIVMGSYSLDVELSRPNTTLTIGRAAALAVPTFLWSEGTLEGEGTLRATRALEVAGVGKKVLGCALVNSGTGTMLNSIVELEGAGSFLNTASFSIMNGEFRQAGGRRSGLEGGGIRNEGSMTVGARASDVALFSGDWANSGRVDVIGSLVHTGGSFQQRGTESVLTLLDATLETAEVNVTAGVLRGSGTLNGSLVVSDAGKLSPGLPGDAGFPPTPARLELIGDLSLLEGSAVLLDLTGSTWSPGLPVDMISLQGHASFVGCHVLPAIASTITPRPADRFRVMQFSSRTGMPNLTPPQGLSLLVTLELTEEHAEVVFQNHGVEAITRPCYYPNELWDNAQSKCVCIFGYTGEHCETNSMAIGLTISLACAGLFFGSLVGVRVVMSRRGKSRSVSPVMDDVAAAPVT